MHYRQTGYKQLHGKQRFCRTKLTGVNATIQFQNDSLRSILYKTQEIIPLTTGKSSSAVIYPIWELTLVQTDQKLLRRYNLIFVLYRFLNSKIGDYLDNLIIAFVLLYVMNKIMTKGFPYLLRQGQRITSLINSKII